MLICLTAAMINLTAIPYNTQDLKNFSRAQYVCSQKEGCLKSFQKREQGIYRALCGEKQEFDRKALDKAELDVILYELDVMAKDIADIADKKEFIKKKLRKIGVEINE